MENELYFLLRDQVMKKLDKLENEFLPQVMVDSTEVIFDTLRFLEAQSKTLIIANTGQVPVQFEFIKKFDDSNYCKDWLHIEPYMGFILPGDKCDVKLEVSAVSVCLSLVFAEKRSFAAENSFNEGSLHVWTNFMSCFRGKWYAFPEP